LAERKVTETAHFLTLGVVRMEVSMPSVRNASGGQPRYPIQ